MQRMWKHPPNSQYTTYVYTQKAPLPKITWSYRGAAPSAPWIRHWATVSSLACSLCFEIHYTSVHTYWSDSYPVAWLGVNPGSVGGQVIPKNSEWMGD